MGLPELSGDNDAYDVMGVRSNPATGLQRLLTHPCAQAPHLWVLMKVAIPMTAQPPVRMGPWSPASVLSSLGPKCKWRPSPVFCSARHCVLNALSHLTLTLQSGEEKMFFKSSLFKMRTLGLREVK